jgi:protein gp37
MTTGIQWTDETWNPAVGCTHISPGCDHCYAATVASRQMQPAHVGLTVGRKWNNTVRLLPERLDEPLRWRKPRRVFVGSMTDLFHLDVPFEFVARVFATMCHTEQHTYQLLTKRPERMARMVGDRMKWYVNQELGYTRAYHGWPLGNVWLGTSIESWRYRFRARQLAAAPAAVRFLSVEPLLGPVDLTDYLEGIHWVIVGAESGPGRRDCCDSWVRDIRDQCSDADVPLFVKQLHGSDGRVLHDLGQFPDDLRIREWPTP